MTSPPAVTHLPRPMQLPCTGALLYAGQFCHGRGSVRSTSMTSWSPLPPGRRASPLLAHAAACCGDASSCSPRRLLVSRPSLDSGRQPPTELLRPSGGREPSLLLPASFLTTGGAPAATWATVGPFRFRNPVASRLSSPACALNSAIFSQVQIVDAVSSDL